MGIQDAGVSPVYLFLPGDIVGRPDLTPVSKSLRMRPDTGINRDRNPMISVFATLLRHRTVTSVAVAALLDSLRGTAEFARLLAVAREGHEAAATAFAQADGHRLLGLPRA